MSHFPAAVPARYWQALPDGRVRCDLCPRRCHLHDGQRGLCFVRAADAGAMVLTTYGRSSGFCIDPIEKKPLHHFLPGTPILSFGTAGCNLTCQFCQNSDISKTRDADRLQQVASPQAIADAAIQTGCRSVAFTYNDPVVFLEYAVDTARACHDRGLKTVAVTAGYIESAPRAELFAHMDAANVDLKAFSEGFYHRQCSAHLHAIQETLRYLAHETPVWLEITTLLIPGLNDSESEIDAMTSWLAEQVGVAVPLHFSAFHPAWKLRDRPATPLETLVMARKIALRNGLRYVYTGNVHHPEGASTVCHHCGTLLIERDWYQLGGVAVGQQGACPTCGTVCPGLFEDQPGTWGRRRAPVRFR